MQKNPIAPALTLTYNKDIRIRREMDSLKIAVCDDDTFFLRQAEHAVKRWAEEQDLTVELQLFDNGDSLLTVSRTEQFDVLLLDIMMPLFNGMELAHVIRKTNTAVKIVFLTSSPEFAVESYDVKASGYLLKPLQYEKLCSVLDDCKAPQPANKKSRVNYGILKVLYRSKTRYQNKTARNVGLKKDIK